MREAHRLPLLRPLAAPPGSQTRTARDALDADDRAGRGGRGARDRRRVRARPPLRAPARVAVPAAGGDRRAHAAASRSAPRVIDMRYENPLYMAEEAAAADLISGGRLQLGISRGSPEPALRGSEAFGHVPARGPDRRRPRARAHRAVPRRDRRRRRRARRHRRRRLDGDAGDPAAVARACPTGSGGARARARPRCGRREQGMNLHELDAAHRGHRRAVRRAAGRADRAVPRGVGRGRLGARAARLGQPQRHADRRPTWTARTSAAAPARDASDQVGYLDGGIARFGRSYIGEPDVIAEELRARRRGPRGRHAAAHRPEPARRRVQRAPAARRSPSTSRRRSAGSARRSESISLFDQAGRRS